MQQPGIDSSNVGVELARWVGLPDPNSPDSSALNLPQSGSQSTSQLQAVIDTIPLYAPLFGEQQLAVLCVLDKLRSTGDVSSIADAATFV